MSQPSMHSSDEQSDEDMAKLAMKDYIYYSRMGRKKALRKIIVAVVVLVVFLSFSYFSLSQVKAIVAGEGGRILGVISPSYFVLVLMVIGVAAGILAYLRPEGRSYSRDSKYTDVYMDKIIQGHGQQIRNLERGFGTVLKKLQTGSDSGEIFSYEEKQRIIDSLSVRLQSEAENEILDRLTQRISYQVANKQADELFARTISRLERELQEQAKRGNVNLTLGIVTTLAGVGVLGYSVFQAPVLVTNMEMVSHFLPRLSLVVLVEVFAYFFLRLYKQGLAEIKYFQNEITNIESKYLGLHVAASHKDNEGLLSVINCLLATERNFVLEKSQTTIDLESKRLDVEREGFLADRLKDLIPSLLKNK